MSDEQKKAEKTGSEKVVDTAKGLSEVVATVTQKPNRFVETIRGLSEITTTYGMAPASFACGVTFAFLSMFQFEKLSGFASYGGLALGSILIFVGVIMHVWKTSREKPRTFPAPPPLDPQFVETLDLLRQLVKIHVPKDRPLHTADDFLNIDESVSSRNE